MWLIDTTALHCSDWVGSGVWQASRPSLPLRIESPVQLRLDDPLDLDGSLDESRGVMCRFLLHPSDDFTGISIYRSSSRCS